MCSSDLREKSGYVQQEISVDEFLTGRENLYLHARINQIPSNLIKSRIDDVLELVELGEKKDQAALTYSGGMRKRVGTARAMIINPPSGLFDAPTAGLDPVTSSTILDMLVHLARELTSATMIISNDLPVLFPICDRVLMLVQGEVVFDGKVDEILASENPAVVQFATGGDTGPL